MKSSRVSEVDPVQESAAEEPAPSQNRRVIKRTPALEAVIGARIRAARVAAGMSQTALGVAVGVTFQQVQKYEQGRDRVAASTLQGFAAALGVHPGSFFDGETALPTGKAAEDRGAMAVAANWLLIRNAETRKGLAKLIATLAGESQAEP